jgi:hypothetical protein
VVLIVMLAAGAALAACGPTGPTGAPTAGSTGVASTAGPSAGASPSGESLEPLPTTAATVAVASSPPCAPADLKASHGLVEGAAGSRLTDVVLVSAIACSVDAYPALGLRDAGGAIVVGAPAAGPGRIDLQPGVGYESVIRIANWCAADPAFPLALEIVHEGQELPVTGSSFPEEGNLPPCNGGGGPILEGGAWLATP